MLSHIRKGKRDQTTFRFLRFFDEATSSIDEAGILFTEQTQAMLTSAWTEASEVRRHHKIGTEHLLWAMINQKDTDAMRLIEASKESLSHLIAEIDALLNSVSEPPVIERYITFLGIPVIKDSSSSYSLTLSAELVFVLAFIEAIRMEHNYVSTSHVLIALSREGDSPASRLLQSEGLTVEFLRETLAHQGKSNEQRI